ncbi:MAG: hypothetical protein [Caudoviricetes sp.]|nr:MAG: hypothetical protein [Caudoviricetes sp.]
MIKVRAWWTKEKEMHDISILDFKHEQVHFLGADTVPLKDVVLLQSTGLKDNDGFEIYQGDILGIISTRKLGYYKTGKLVKRVVEYGEFWAKENTLYQFQGFFLDGDSSIQYFVNKGAVIIGNIYENPELLKEV